MKVITEEKRKRLRKNDEIRRIALNDEIAKRVRNRMNPVYFYRGKKRYLRSWMMLSQKMDTLVTMPFYAILKEEKKDVRSRTSRKKKKSHESLLETETG